MISYMIKIFKINFLLKEGLPHGPAGKESACNAGDRRYRLDSWVGKILWRRKLQPTLVFLPEKSHG